MGEAFYDFLLILFSNPANHNISPDRVVSSALSNLGMSMAYFWLMGVLLWLTRKSVLLSKMPLIYLFAAFIGLCGLARFGHVVMFPDWLQLTVEFTGTVVSIYTAYFTFKIRHVILSMIYQFKYVLGLLKTLDKLEEVDR